MTTKEFNGDEASKAEASQQCEAAAATFMAENTRWYEELAALAKAKEVIWETI